MASRVRISALLSAAAVVATGFLGPQLLYAQEASGSADENWDAIVQCAKFDRSKDRHECMDAVLRAVGLIDRPREVAEQRETFGQNQTEERADPVDLPHVAASAPPPPAELSRLLTTIVESLIGSDRKLIVRTEEGAVWKQVDGARIRVEPDGGTPFSIEEAALGSFRCRYGSTVYRCERLD